MKSTKQLKTMRPKTNKVVRRKPLRANIATIMETSSTTYQYIPTVVGPGKVTFDKNVYEYHFKSLGVTFWKCEHVSTCNAEIITKGNQAWVMEADHNH